METELNGLSIAHKINRQLPPDAAIDRNSDGRWEWTFRCVESDGVEGCEDGFDTPLDALLGFTNFLLCDYHVYR